MKTTPTFLLIFSLMLLSCSGGCRPSNRLTGLVAGEGVVLYDGSPLAGASLTFHADGDGAVRGALGTTDAAGKFRLMTLHPGDGIEPGKYVVTVEKVKKQPETDPETARKIMSGEIIPDSADPMKPQVIEHEINAKYADKKTSGLNITIGPKGDKNIELRLEP